MPYHTVIFDFGNVIGFFDYGIAWRRLAACTPLTQDQIAARMREADISDAYESGRMTSREFIRFLQQTCRIDAPEATIAEAWSDIFTPNEPVCRLIPDLADRYRLVLGSNTNELHFEHYRRQFADVLRHFTALCVSHEIGVCKPNEGFYRALLERAGAEPQECLFIDDRQENVTAAQACGIDAIQYTRYETLLESLSLRGILVGVPNDAEKADRNRLA